MEMRKFFLLTVLAIGATTGNSPFADLSTNNTFIGGKLMIRIPEILPIYDYSEFYSDCALYGFNIDKCWKPFKMKTFTIGFDDYKERDELQYQTDIQQVLLRHCTNTNVFCVAYRIVTSPVGTRHWGFMGIDSYGDTWYTQKIKTTVSLESSHQIGQWAPKNQPASYSGTIGVGLDSSGPTVSASVNYEVEQLRVISRTNVATRTYETEYNISGTNNYNRYSAEYFGFFTFSSNNIGLYPLVALNHEVTYLGNEYYGYVTRYLTVEFKFDLNFQPTIHF